jgi:hypothetical protein
MTEPASREQTAYHEAGHAVAAVRLNIDFARVSIVPGDGTLGHSSSADWRSLNNTRRGADGALVFDADRLAACLVELYAGFAAEAHAVPGADPEGSCSDSAAAAEILAAAGWNEAAYRDRAERFVREHWASIALVARELLHWDTLDHGEVEGLVDVVSGATKPADLTRFRILMGRVPGEGADLEHARLLESIAAVRRETQT